MVRTSRRQMLAAVAGGMLAARGQESISSGQGMIVRSAQPLDLEMPLSGFSEYLTPTEQFFVRTHVYAPTTNLETWRLQVDGHVENSLTLSMDDVRKMPAVELISVLECAGNGRAFFDPPVPGLQWEYGAVGNARWRGIRLGDVLKRAGAKAGAVEVLFDGADVPLGKMADFRRSIPIKKALHADTLLAYEMNGKPLPAQHGFPLRAVVPGWAGDSWAKWVTGIRVLPEADSGYWMTSAYKRPDRTVAPGTVLPVATLPPVSNIGVKSVIAAPASGSLFKPGELVVVRGAAWSGESGPVRRVRVSVDAGRTWSDARLLDPSTRWGWRRWEFIWKPAEEGYYTVFARVEDEGGKTQPSVQEWNQSGYLWNVTPRINVQVAPSATPATSTAPNENPSLPTALRQRCVVCHRDDVIRQQHLTRAQWDREITKMADWGADVKPEDRPSMLDFLSSTFGLNH